MSGAASATTSRLGSMDRVRLVADGGPHSFRKCVRNFIWPSRKVKVPALLNMVHILFQTLGVRSRNKP